MSKSLVNLYKAYKNKVESGDLKKSPILIFDMMYLFKSNYAVRPLISEGGTMLGGVAGVIDMIIKTTYKFNSDRVICVFDGKNHHSRRKKIYEDYKANRNKNSASFSNPFNLSPEEKKVDEEFQLKLLKHLVKLLPLKAFSVEGYEADDIIAYLSNVYLPSQNKAKDGVIVVTGDRDMFQLINDDVRVYYHNKQKVLVSKNNFKEYWDTDFVDNMVLIRCIEGDTSDNIKGVGGIKITSLIKLLPEIQTRHLPDVDSLVNLMEENRVSLMSSTKGKKLLESVDVIRRNYQLMKLPMPINPFVEMKLTDMIRTSEHAPDNMGRIIKTLVDYKLTDVINPDRITKFFSHLKNI